MSRYRDPLLHIPTSIDILYLGGIFVAFVTLNFVSTPILYFIYPVLLWSIYQDWRSARIAEQREHWYFLISDLLTVLNYVAIFISSTLPPHPRLGYSERIWLNWGLVFAIYIVWNMVMRQLPTTDKSSRSFFLNYSLIESPIVIYCFLIYFEARTGTLLLKGFDLLTHPVLLLFFMGAIHLGILFYWVYQTYITKK
jgi:hypothetical protein